MRTPIFSPTIFVFALACYATLNLSSCRSLAKARHNSNVSTENAGGLKQKTVLLILPASEYKFIDDYKALVHSAWTMTPIEVIRYDELPAYAAEADRYAYFQIGGIESVNNPTSLPRTDPQYNQTEMINTHYYLALMLANKRIDKSHSGYLCRIELYPEFATTNYRFYKKDLEEQVYVRSAFRNFQLPYILAYLKFVDKNLKQQKNPWVYDNYKDDNLISRLHKDTLYILDNALFERNKFTGKEIPMLSSIFESYGGKYKFVKTEALISIIRNKKDNKPLFLFEYVQSSTDKFVGVVDVTSGSVVYRQYTAVSYNLKPKDVEKILE